MPVYNPTSTIYNVGDCFAPIIATTLDYYSLFCLIICIGMSVNKMYLKAEEHSFYFPIFFAVVCVGISAVCTLLEHRYSSIEETEDHLYVENKSRY